MERKEFIEKVAAKLGVDANEVEQVFQKFIEITTTALRDGEKVTIAGFGTFSPKITKATKKFSALLNREIEIPEKYTISFSPASKLADEINIKYKDEKPQVIKEATEREIEKKVTIMPSEPEEEELKAQKLLEEISKLEQKESEEITQSEPEEDVSLSSELLEALQDIEVDLGEKQDAIEETVNVQEKKEEIKEEVSQMPEMNLNQEKPKFTFGEDLSTQSTGGGYQQASPSSRTTDAPAFKEKESSSALWVTLIILLIGIIGVGIYWALSSDVTETKKENIATIEKETTPPVVIEKQAPKGKKEIIIAPEEYATIPDTGIKSTTPLIVEEPKQEAKLDKKKPVVIVEPEKEKTAEIKATTTTEKRKPISRRTSKVTTITKKTAAGSQGEYFIQVNSYTDKRIADQFAKNLRNKGYRAFVESAVSSQLGRVFRVKVGFYPDEDAAAKDYHSLRLLLQKEDIFVDRRY